MPSAVKLLAILGVASSVLGDIAPDGAWAQTSPPSPGLKASVGIRATSNRQSDRPGGTYVGDDLLPAESARLNVIAGRGDDLCSTSVWTSGSGSFPGAMQVKVDQLEAAALYIWRFDVTMREVMTDRITFDLTWQRTSREAPRAPLRQSQRLTLREGESRPIDLLHGTPDSDCLSVVLEVTAGIMENPALQVKTLEWDLWFNGSPQTAPAHQTLTSPHGERVSFQFEPVATIASQPSGKVEVVLVQVHGQLTGRVRPDGRIDVALSTNRFISSGPSRSLRPVLSWPGRAGGSGQKNFSLTSGEAVKIVLPPLNPAAPVQFGVDPVTGGQTATAAPRPTASASDTTEMSITVQARVR